MIKVSIIVPIYNTGKYLKKCIDSLLSQTEKNIEVILVNDGSTDNSEDIIKEYKDKRIRYISKPNEGIGKTRNRGIKEAKGKYLMFIDSDDYISSNCVEVMLSMATSNNADIVISNFYKDYDGKLENVNYPFFKPSSLKDNPDIMNMINLGPCNKLYLTELVKSNKFDEDIKYEDVNFVVSSLLKANKIVKINDYLSYYVIHSNSETTTRDKKIYDIIEVVERLKKKVKNMDYLKDNFVDLAVMILTDYTIQTRYIKDYRIRHGFIKKVFQTLNRIDKNWRKCRFLTKEDKNVRIIKKSCILTIIYCDIIGRKYR